MREKIEKRLKAIRRGVGERGYTDGTEIATQEEMYWLVCQAARGGIMLNVAKDPNVYQKDDECYYYYTAMSVNAGKERVRDFVDTYPLMTVGVLNSLIKETDESLATENIKQIRRLIQARNRRNRARRRKAEQRIAELEEEARIEAEHQEAAANCDNLDWLVDRIESLGWEVTLRRKNNN